MDNEFIELLKRAKELYPNSDVIKAYEDNFNNYNLKDLKRNLNLAINRKNQTNGKC